ncbi:MAG: hypothetical protein ACTSWD_08180 [Candidatus Heimdallarchaeota archaeon]
MKKLFFLSLLVIYINSVYAVVKSMPSTVVGHVKIEAQTNSWTMLALPFDLNGALVSEVFSHGSGNPYITGGPNPVFSDQIQEIGGSVAWYSSALSTWMGNFDVDVCKAYYAVVRNGNPSAEIYVYGSVDHDTVVNYDPIPGNTWTAIGFRETERISIGDLGLLEAGFTGGPNPVFSDQIQEIGGSVAWYSTSLNSWMPDTFTIKPGKAYYLVIRASHTGLPNYTYPFNSENRKSIDKTNNKEISKKKN